MSAGPNERCPKCGASAPRYGVRERQRRYLSRSGALERRLERVQRFRCTACKHVFEQPLGAESLAALDAVVASAVRNGCVSAAATHGCHEETVARFLTEWIGRRENEISEATPDLLMLAAVRAAGQDRVAAFCPVSGQLLDLLRNREAVAPWLRRRADLPGSVCIDIDAGMLAVLAPFSAEIALLVQPAAAARSIEAAAVALFRKMVREAPYGRNYRESATLFRRPDAALSDDDREELRNWSEEPRKLRYAAAMLLADVARAPPARLADTIRRAKALLDAAAPASALAVFLRRWERLLVAGAAERGVDDCHGDLTELRGSARRMRPAAGFERLRAAVMFMTPRGASTGGESYGPTLFDAAAGLRALG